ncbi:dihydrolipoamide acetyltransferase family protein [Futiania mangrovi]|uniref:Dihydrolipoamide acetyltransferase component of pyruvate dehydrogenase complex n=1 Tax=Futiania mangrovi TaxID=2959716 RepID=A0A9J6PKX9_9PROT|nr:dihydrolipoamide acetyltransferase family protein [Futiania mangrovii]MCP1337247.1 2-oxo acid dehydrogenase subunit E2 [Futiania mangrovii]
MSGVRDIVMPKLGLTMTEGLVTEWRVGPGDRFAPGDILLVIETEKIANEIEAEDAGEIAEILVGEGETVAVGTPLARLKAGGAAGTAKSEAAPAETPSEKPTATEPKLAAAATAPRKEGERIIATPLARRIARQDGVDLAAVAGSGPRGRIKAEDVEAAKARQASTAAMPEGPAPEGERVAVTGAQATIVRRLTQSKQEIPHFYVAADADVGPLMALRAQVNAVGDWPRTTLTHWIVAAMGRALTEMPQMNRVWDDGHLVSLPRADVGLAVDTPRGLYVPVVRDAGHRSVGEIAVAAGALVEKARGGGLDAAAMAGGAITLSNVGTNAVRYLTPIINPGQAMILGAGAVGEVFRPDAEGRPVLKRELGLVLACDHRVINGMDGAAFLARVVELIGQPMRLLTVPAKEG